MLELIPPNSRLGDRGESKVGSQALRGLHSDRQDDEAWVLGSNPSAIRLAVGPLGTGRG